MLNPIEEITSYCSILTRFDILLPNKRCSEDSHKEWWAILECRIMEGYTSAMRWNSQPFKVSKLVELRNKYIIEAKNIRKANIAKCCNFKVIHSPKFKNIKVEQLIDKFIVHMLKKICQLQEKL
jgi:hypothetical protein